uniref:Uncharacterized protein n=1 Tax=Rhabditophanes sp. KR3021 TaxID=114890 RepID=A0AC35TYI9_9BILA
MSESEVAAAAVKMRGTRLNAVSPLATNNNEGVGVNVDYNTIKDGSTHSLIGRTMGILQETDPEHEESSEEIRRLDSQLDHLNEYMNKVEKRLRDHSDKLIATLQEQREEREKRRQSFHERIATAEQEDTDYKARLGQLLNRVDVSKNRASIYDIISTMEMPIVDEEKK